MGKGGWGKGSWNDMWMLMSMMKGGWGGKGWGGKGGVWKKKNKNRPPKNAVDDSFTVDSTQRFTGTVDQYYKFQGYGFITMDAKGVVPGDSVFAHFENIKSHDRYPFLEKDMKVQFTLSKVEYNGKKVIEAENISTAEGAPIAIQDQSDAAHKTFIGDQFLRYSGKVKFFDPKKGFGYITMDDGFALTEEVPKDLRVEIQEINAGGKKPGRIQEQAVEFGIYKTKGKKYYAYNVTLPGGQLVPAATEEEKK